MDEDKRLVSAVDYYFIQDDGGRFKVKQTNCRPCRVLVTSDSAPGTSVVTINRNNRLISK